MADLPVATTPPAIGVVTSSLVRDCLPTDRGGGILAAARCVAVLASTPMCRSPRPEPSLVVLPTSGRNHTNDLDDMTYPDDYTHMYALRTENRWLAPSTGRSPTTSENRLAPARCGRGTGCQPSHGWPPPTAHPAAPSGSPSGCSPPTGSSRPGRAWAPSSASPRRPLPSCSPGRKTGRPASSRTQRCSQRANAHTGP